jgi:hypothetical protein
MRVCKFCQRPHPISDEGYAENPFCNSCLHERVRITVEARAEEHEEHVHWHALAVTARNGEVDYWICECGDRWYPPADPTPPSAGKEEP